MRLQGLVEQTRFVGWLLGSFMGESKSVSAWQAPASWPAGRASVVHSLCMGGTPWGRLLSPAARVISCYLELPRIFVPRALLLFTFPQVRQVSAQLPCVLLLGSFLRKVLGLASFLLYSIAAGGLWCDGRGLCTATLGSARRLRTCMGLAVSASAPSQYQGCSLNARQGWRARKIQIQKRGCRDWLLIGAVGAVLQAVLCDSGTCIKYLSLFGRRECYISSLLERKIKIRN